VKAISISFRVVDAMNTSDPVQAIGHLYAADGALVGEATTNGTGELWLSVPASVRLADASIIVSPEAGYWMTIHSDLRDGEILPVRALNLPSKPWWKRCIGVGKEPSGMDRVRIGIIDRPWCDDIGLEHVTRLWSDGSKATVIGASAHPALWSHGEQVMRVLSQSKKLGASLAGMASEASAVCIFGGAIDRSPDFSEIAAGIMLLAERHDVHLINVSAGSFDASAVERAAVEIAVDFAWDLGTVCVVAAGNRAIASVAFPASMQRCVAVGAVGWDSTWGPVGSVVRAVREEAKVVRSPCGVSERKVRVYASPRACYGKGLDVVAPGVGLVSAHPRQPGFDLTGTSFSAPAVVAVLAAALATDDEYLGMPRDASRSRYVVEEILPCYTRSAGLSKGYEGLGIPAL
jgi:hypothetical protein